ncbi:hypothetical protein GCM10010402_52910 [Actinomadura luteofluorescens]|uniref:hypothetical protein n=1 Tax=Actinomadura luteofluorescens TaxID=46163 RepID=UPI002164AE8C|nr:hypothetical protein [Actinomadura glauciflava]MCR3745049.1 hypothetical protein [Actinomadura glauciflava]
MIDWSAVDIGAEHEAALRVYLLDGPAAWLAIQDDLVVPQTAAGYTQVLQAAFGVAVRRRFSAGYDINQLIRYVADVRLLLRKSGKDINPRIGESLIRRHLGDPTISEDAKPVEAADVEQETVTLTTLLRFLVNESEPSSEWLDEFVREAADAARLWLEAQRTAAAR